MCGIVAYLGHQEAAAILLSGLTRLEYRGYDSSGIAVQHADGHIQVRKKEGKVSNCSNLVQQSPCPGTAGIAHTRWATHGPPSDRNSHPHCNGAETIAVVHNGIIENEASLRVMLKEEGYVFKSDTDTEVLAHLLDSIIKKTGLKLAEAVPLALRRVVGSYGVVFMSSLEPDVLVGAKNGSPLMLGIGSEGDFFVGSDATPFVEFTKKVVAIEDEEFLVLERGKEFQVMSLDQQVRHKSITELEWDLEEIEKGGYPYFMVKEIMEQPKSLENCMRGRIDRSRSSPRIKLGGLRHEWKGQPIIGALRNAKRLLFVACGTSYHAAMAGAMVTRTLTGIPCDVEVASEFRYMNPILNEGDVLIAVSQSGETADTLAAIKLAQSSGILCLGVVNVVGSTIARETDAGIYLHAGPEIGVASTKAYTGQVLVLSMLALSLGQDSTISDSDMYNYISGLEKIPGVVREVLAPERDQELQRLANTYRYAKNFLFLGVGCEFPVALEGALKLKEISYIHAEGYPIGEVKHGMIALVDQFMPMLVIARQGPSFESRVNTIRELASRMASVIVVTDAEGDALDNLNHLCEDVIHIPQVHEFLAPLVSVIPMQALSYHIAVIRGCNVDKPRNLAKAVTVE